MKEKNTHIKLIITDFDGVILESEGAKSRAFFDCFSIFPEHIDQIMAFHRANATVSRYDKFEYIYKEILKLKYTKDEMDWVARRFNDIIFQGVVASPPVPGAFDFLNTFSKLVSIYVVSATPVKELMKVLEALDLVKYFQKVYGIPPEKSKILSNILKETGLRPKETIFIGDTNNDLNAAHANQIPFIARRNGQEFSGPYICEIDDLFLLRHYLQIDSEQKVVRLRLDMKGGIKA